MADGTDGPSPAEIGLTQKDLGVKPDSTKVAKIEQFRTSADPHRSLVMERVTLHGTTDVVRDNLHDLNERSWNEIQSGKLKPEEEAQVKSRLRDSRLQLGLLKMAETAVIQKRAAEAETQGNSALEGFARNIPAQEVSSALEAEMTKWMDTLKKDPQAETGNYNQYLTETPHQTRINPSTGKDEFTPEIDTELLAMQRKDRFPVRDLLSSARNLNQTLSLEAAKAA